MSGDVLVRRTAVMAAGTVLSRLTGFGRVFALAYAFNFTRLTDAYTLANTTPNIVYELALGGVLSATLVPVFVDLLGRGDEEGAWAHVSAVVTTALVVLVGLTALFALAAPAVIGLYTVGRTGDVAADQRAVATFLLFLFAPQVLLYGVITMATALANVRRRFAAPMFAPVFNNLVVIGVLLAVPHVAGSLSVAAVRGDTTTLLLLGLGTTAGVAVQALAQVFALRGAGIRLRWRWAPGDPAVRRVLRLSGWTFGFAAANQVALYVVLVLANQGDGGDVTAYQAGQMFFLLPHGVFSVSIMTALLPDLAERWARGDVEAFRRGVVLGLRSIAFVLLPAAVGYLALARPVVDVALDHGAFRASSVEATAGVLACLAVGLPAFSAYLMLMRAYQAMQDTRTMFRLYVVENGLNVALAFALYPSMGVAGLALAFALAYTAGTLLAFDRLRRRTGGLGGGELLRSLGRTAAAAAVMGAVVTAASRTTDEPLLQVGIAVPLGISVYVLVARAVGAGELQALFRTRRPPA
ncbi:MAG TPA: murein biosynthesis integral membrane protein MurJ [Acidimicrobiales bacterium]|nr:murein biosynthesis integral membrane protein MurJ [Acidimicrobiales bacterium]